MGFFKKKGDKDSPASQNTNPYAQAPANPYQQAKSRAYAPSEPSQRGSPPPPYDNGRGGAPGGGYPSDKKNPYAAGAGYAQQDQQGGGGGGGGYGGRGNAGGGGGYGANPYGGQSGYGNDRYGGGQQGAPSQGGSRYGPGGYGGMGGGSDNPYGNSNPQDDASRNALFGGPPQPAKQGQSSSGQGAPSQNPYAMSAGPSGPPAKNPYDQANPTATGGGFSSDGGYVPSGPSYNDRQMTAEEEEEAEVQATKNEIRQIKQQDVASTRNALRLANRAEEVGRDTLARLGAQGESLFNAEKSLDLAHNHNKRAEDKARELKTLNRSMFAVHVANPFTSKSRQEAADQAVVDRHVEERGAREATRREAYLQDQRMQKNFGDLSQANEPQAKRERNLAERAKYQFEADSEDEEMENEIDANLDALSGAAGRLNLLAKATGKEVDAQNKRLDALAAKSDRVDVDLARNHAKINRIK